MIRALTIGDADYWLGLADQLHIDWEEVAQRLPLADAMRNCIQDTKFHAEGDVWTHTIMVVEELRRHRATLAVSEDRWRGLFLAALLHDIAKPATRTEEVDSTGRLCVHHYGHSRLGAVMAWELLWRLGLPRAIREQVFHLVRWHQRPFHITFAPTLEREVILFSQVGVWNELIALAHADNRGRIAPNTDETANVLTLLSEEIEGYGCVDRPWPFPSDTARVWFCRKEGRSPLFDPQPPQGSSVIILSGLPGAGKDTYCQTQFADLPQVSLDKWRAKLRIGPNDAQGKVVQAATEEARTYLRVKKAFIWNATNLSRLNRDKAVGLCLDYDAMVAIHAFDPEPSRLLAQNRSRDAEVPESVIARLAQKWEPPSVLEAHQVKWLD